MLSERIDSDLIKALKAKDMDRLNVLRMVKAALKNEEIAKKGPLPDEEAVLVLDRLAKQRQDSVSQYRNAGRDDLALKEEREISVIDEYRPQKLSEEEVRIEVKKILSQAETQDFGQIMRAVMAVLKGKADGTIVSKIVKEETQNA